MQVSHVAGEELDIRAADPHPVHVHDDLAGAGHRGLDVEHGRLAWPGQDEREHQTVLTGRGSMMDRIAGKSSSSAVSGVR